MEFKEGDLVEVVGGGYPITGKGSYGKIVKIHAGLRWVTVEFIKIKLPDNRSIKFSPGNRPSYPVSIKDLKLRPNGKFQRQGFKRWF